MKKEESILSETGRISPLLIKKTVMPVSVEGYKEAIIALGVAGQMFKGATINEITQSILDEKINESLLDRCKKLREEIEKEIHTTYHKHVTRMQRLKFALLSIAKCVIEIWMLCDNDNEIHPNVVLDILNILYKTEIVSGTRTNIIHFSISKLINVIATVLNEYVVDIPTGTKLEIPKMSLEVGKPVEEHCKLPSFSDFILIIKNLKPIVFRGAVSYWPALKDRPWTDIKYLIDAIGPMRLVPIEIGSKYTNENWTQKLMPFQEFVTKYLISNSEEENTVNEIGYLAQYELFNCVPTLLNDILVPDQCYIPFSDDKGEKECSEPIINIWLGPKNTISPLHTDPYHNYFVQIFGYKYIRFYSYSESDKLYASKDELSKNTSMVDIDNVDHEKNPSFKEANYSECILGPGDMCIIPINWWHYVKSITESCSLSIWIKE